MVLSSNVFPLLTLMLCVRNVIMTNYKMIDVVRDRGKYNPILICNFPADFEMLLVINLGHYANMPMQYTAIFHGCKNVIFQMKKYNIFSYLCSKH